ncbi:Serine protease easter-like Protein [Tribolium castaneum]|nr:PREDICTED: serine protease easter [Tribolium castaneum]KYB29265.1 Serine protease easter-like Protein [Tribolium castaneum]|eukprot:XP_015840614.1 PREDICTED: serine protease easter [Tribolium castaneum]
MLTTYLNQLLLLILVLFQTYSPVQNNSTVDPKGCVYLNDCPKALELIQSRRNDRKVIDFLRSISCGNSLRKDMILCENISSFTATRSKFVSDSECGTQSTSAKITHGKRAQIDEFPWLALLKYKNRTNHIEYRCHGSLISSKYVLTASHCLSYSDRLKSRYGELYSVVLGEYNTRTVRDCATPPDDCTDPIQEFSPEAVFTHPKFLSEGALSDIALVRLNGSARFSDFVRPICLPTNTFILNENETLLISGWGKTENRTTSDVKLKGKIKYLTQDSCSMRLDDSQICAGSSDGTDTCQGDSGGPLMVHRQTNGEMRFFLVGVVSFGKECGSGSAVYTNVMKFVDWIVDKMSSG